MWRKVRERHKQQTTSGAKKLALERHRHTHTNTIRLTKTAWGELKMWWVKYIKCLLLNKEKRN